MAPSNAGVESEPQPLAGSSHPTAICVFQTSDKSLCLTAYKTPFFPVAAMSAAPLPGTLNNVGDEPQSKSVLPSTSSLGRRK